MPVHGMTLFPHKMDFSFLCEKIAVAESGEGEGRGGKQTFNNVWSPHMEAPKGEGEKEKKIKMLVGQTLFRHLGKQTKKEKFER